MIATWMVGLAWGMPSVLPLPSGPGSLAPDLLVTPAGLRMTWLEPRARGHALLTSGWKGGAWSAPVTIARSDALVANWADTPNLGVAGDGALVVSYPRRSGSGVYAYDVVMARSVGGQQWTDLGSPHRDGTETEHGFTSFVPEGDGFRVFWLDGRLTADGGPMALRTSVWTGRFADSAVVDPRVCDCCGTAATRSAEGWTAVYRDRSEGEVRDTRAATAAGTLAVAGDGWQMPGCPVNGPQIVHTPHGDLAAWTTGALGPMEVRVALGTGGRFGEPSVLVPASDKPVGRVDLVAKGSEVYVTWLGAAGIMARRLVVSDGSIVAGPPVRLAKASGDRKTGFPRVILKGETLVSVWTTQAGVVGDERALVDLGGPTEALPKVGDAVAPAILGLPKLDGQTLAGSPWKLKKVDGPVFVALWASWCGPCRAELPALIELAANNPEVPLIVVAVDDDAAAVKRAVPDRPGTWVMASRAAVEEAFLTAAVPAVWLFDKGQVVWSADGALDSAKATRAARSRQ